MAENENDNYDQIFPSYEIVKRNILMYWVEIQIEYERFKKLQYLHKDMDISTLNSKITGLYVTLLRPKIKKIWKTETKKLELFLKKMDDYVKTGVKKEDIDTIVMEIGQFLEDSKLTDITYTTVPWEQSFKSTYS